MDFSVFYASFGRDFSSEPLDILSRAAAIGFDAVEVSVNDRLMAKGKEYFRRLKGSAEDLGLKITCCGGGLNEKCDITSPDEKVRRAGITRIRKVLSVAKELGSDGLDGINYVPWNLISYPVNKAARMEICAKSLKELCSFAEDIEIWYALEVANRYEEFLLNTAAEAVEMCERVGSPSLKIQLDTYHMNIEEDDMYDAIAAAGSRLYSLHVSENNRKIPTGRGMLPWDRVARAIKDINFDGHVELEPFLLTGGEIMYSSKIWRDNVASDDSEIIDRELRKGLDFIKKLFNTERKF